MIKRIPARLKYLGFEATPRNYLDAFWSLYLCLLCLDGSGSVCFLFAKEPYSAVAGAAAS